MAGDGLHADGGGEVALAGAGAADEHDVLGLFGGVDAGELFDLPAVGLALGVIEAGQIAVYREACRVHLVADRAQVAVGTLGFEQVAQQRILDLQA